MCAIALAVGSGELGRGNDGMEGTFAVSIAIQKLQGRNRHVNAALVLLRTSLRLLNVHACRNNWRAQQRHAHSLQASGSQMMRLVVFVTVGCRSAAASSCV